MEINRFSSLVSMLMAMTFSVATASVTTYYHHPSSGTAHNRVARELLSSAVHQHQHHPTADFVQVIYRRLPRTPQWDRDYGYENYGGYESYGGYNSYGGGYGGGYDTYGGYDNYGGGYLGWREGQKNGTAPLPADSAAPIHPVLDTDVAPAQVQPAVAVPASSKTSIDDKISFE